MRPTSRLHRTLRWRQGCIQGFTGAGSVSRNVKMWVLFVIKSIIKGAVACAVAGVFVGGVAALLLWPGSNLGPPVGMFYGAIWGAIVGAILGLAFGVKPLLSSKSRTVS